jgi:hypothetical protein
MRTKFYCFIIQNTDSSLQHDSSKQLQILHVSLPNTKTNPTPWSTDILQRHSASWSFKILKGILYPSQSQ